MGSTQSVPAPIQIPGPPGPKGDKGDTGITTIDYANVPQSFVDAVAAELYSHSGTSITNTIATNFANQNSFQDTIANTLANNANFIKSISNQSGNAITCTANGCFLPAGNGSFFAPVGGNVGLGVATGTLTAGNPPLFNVGTYSGKAAASVGMGNLPSGQTINGLMLPASSRIQLGFDDASRQQDAGTIGYGTPNDANALNIVGKGQAGTPRSVTVYDNLNVNGQLNSGGSLGVNGNINTNGSINANSDINSNGAINANGNINSKGNVGMNDLILGNNSNNSYIIQSSNPSGMYIAPGSNGGNWDWGHGMSFTKDGKLTVNQICFNNSNYCLTGHPANPNNWVAVNKSWNYNNADGSYNGKQIVWS